jgi:hypothetical protein
MKCSILFRAVLVTAFGVSLLSPVLARQGTKMDPNAKTMTIEGAVRDLACPVQNPAGTATNFDLKCTRDCVRHGSPIIILSKDGFIYFAISADKYSKPEQIVNLHAELLERVRHIPGVTAAGLTNVVPGDGYYGEREFSVPEHPPQPLGEHHFGAYRTADPEYFATLQIPLVRGRLFSENDRLEHDKYAIVNQEFVRQVFPAEDPIGKHLSVKWRTPQGESY